LKLVGFADPEFGALLRARYREPGIQWYGEIPHDRIRATVRTAHFFIFPTRFVGENHSNALTECMAEGVVPIVSDHGANARIVGEAGAVLSGVANERDYADAVATIWGQGQWLRRSRMCTRIAEEKFGIEAAADRLLGIYRSLMDSKTE
jgi:glycosyltransferase involved in cell wall biosynthesis